MSINNFSVKKKTNRNSLNELNSLNDSLYETNFGFDCDINKTKRFLEIKEYSNLY